MTHNEDLQQQLLKSIKDNLFLIQDIILVEFFGQNAKFRFSSVLLLDFYELLRAAPWLKDLLLCYYPKVLLLIRIYKKTYGRYNYLLHADKLVREFISCIENERGIMYYHEGDNDAKEENLLVTLKISKRLSKIFSATTNSPLISVNLPDLQKTVSIKRSAIQAFPCQPLAFFKEVIESDLIGNNLNCLLELYFKQIFLFRSFRE